MQSQAEQWLREGLRLHQAGRLEEAEGFYRRVLAERPGAGKGQGQALHLMGVLLGQRGDARGAVEMICKAIAAVPGQAVFYGNLGKYLMDVGDVEGAIAAGREAVRLKPDFVEGHYNLGHALHIKGKLEAAAASYRRALEIKPGMVVARKNLGHVLRELGRAQEAMRCYREVLRVDPRLGEVHLRLGMTLLDQGQFSGAMASFREAIGLMPQNAQAHDHLGHALHYTGKLDEAEACYRKAIELEPGLAEAHNNLGMLLKDRGEIEAAVEAYRRAAALRPENRAIGSNLLLALHYDPRSTEESLLGEARAWEARFAEPLSRERLEYAITREPERPLRVGYVSADFREHASAFFLMPLLAHHDRERFSIVCYSSVARPDHLTRQFQALTGPAGGGWQGWWDIAGVSDEGLAQIVREDRVDILVDLKLHTDRNRLLVFARKPAPVQVTWLGYPGTTGMSAIDVRLTDPYLDPEGVDAFYAERSVRLPETFWCYDPLVSGTELPVNDLPARRGGGITFGCLNNLAKINDGVLELWAKVLVRVPGSRVMLLAPAGRHVGRIGSFLARRGVTEERLVVCEPRARREYLKLYHEMDVMLDTFPYNGHTTSLDALWMGVPVVTRVGRTAVGRAGLSQLSNLNLSQLAAQSDEEYVHIAAELTGDLERLAELRAGLRARMESSALMDGRRFARNVESAFRDMWRRWCRGQGRQSDLA